MHRQRLSTIVWLGAVLALLAALGAGSLWWERASETAANQEAINSQEDSGVTLPEPELTQESDLPEHPLESMGIAKLTESQGMPEDAISEEEAIDLVTELTRGRNGISIWISTRRVQFRRPMMLKRTRWGRRRITCRYGWLSWTGGGRRFPAGLACHRVGLTRR